MGKCTVQDVWLLKKDSCNNTISTWGQKYSKTQVFCIACSNIINCESKGFQALFQHSNSIKHEQNVKVKLGEQQLHLCSVPPNVLPGNNALAQKGVQTLAISTSYSSRDLATRAEILWTMKSVVNNMSTTSCDGLADIFKAMFSGTFVDTNFSLSRTKLSYLITDCLGPHFRKMLLDECQACYYTIIYDETTNSEGVKELQCAIRYWSNDTKGVVVRHLETFFIGSATGLILTDYIIKAINNANLSIDKLLMLGSDGPNVNKMVFKLVNENVKSIRGIGLIDIGTCNIHIVHNAFLKGLEYIGIRVSNFVIDVYYFFHGWPKRYEDYSKIQKENSIPYHKFLKHCASRWLTLSDSTARIIEQWDGLLKYFLTFVPNSQKSLLKTNKYKNIVDCLNCTTFRAELEFILWSTSIFQRFTGMLQRQEPLIHIMHEELSQLVCIIADYVCKEDIVKVWLKNNSVDIFDMNNLKSIDKIYLPDKLKLHLDKIVELDKRLFLTNIRKHFVAAGNHILQKSSIQDSSKLKYFRCLKIDEIKKSRSVSDIEKISKIMPFKVDLYKLIDEWKLLKHETFTNTTVRIDHFWYNIFELKTGFGESKYPTVTQLVKSCLTLSHGSAEVERGFSLSGNIITDDKATMSCRMLNSRLNIKGGLSRFNERPELVPLTKELLVSARLAHSKYIRYLDELKSKNMEEVQKKNLERSEREHENQRKETELKILESKKNIDKLEEELTKSRKIELKQIEAADKFLEEATERLQMAIKKNDLVNAQIAVGMLETAKKLREDERDRCSKTESIKKNIEKRKSNLITQFTKKLKKD